MEVTASLELINKTLKEYPFSKKPLELYQPMEYLLGLETHRFYAMLTLWGCYLFSGDARPAVRPALGVEIFYKFLMVHGALIEQDQPRSKSAPIHHKWNRNVAILSGDAMIFRAYEFLITVETPMIKSVVREFNRCFITACEGKQRSINDPSMKRDPEILKLYPGSIGEFSLFLGAFIGGANKPQQAAAARLGTEIAIELITDNYGEGSGIYRYLDDLYCDDTRKETFASWYLQDNPGLSVD